MTVLSPLLNALSSILAWLGICDHQWERYHPSGYQEYVRKERCTRCARVHNEGVRGESGQIIDLGFDSETGRKIFGYKGW